MSQDDGRSWLNVHHQRLYHWLPPHLISKSSLSLILTSILINCPAGKHLINMHVANFGSTTAVALIATLVTAPLVGALPVDAPPNPLPLTASPTDLLPHINSPSPFEKRDASWTAYPTMAVPTQPALTTEAPFMTLSRLHSGDGDNRIWIPSTKEIRSSGYPPARMGKREESTPTLKEHVPAKALPEWEHSQTQIPPPDACGIFSTNIVGVNICPLLNGFSKRAIKNNGLHRRGDDMPDRIPATLPSPAEPEAKVAVGIAAAAAEAKKTRKRCRVSQGRRICDRGPDYADGIVAGGHSDKKHHTKRKHSDRDHHESDKNHHLYHSDKDHHPSYVIKENNLQRREDGEIPTPLPLPLSAKPDANIYKRKIRCKAGTDYPCPTHSHPPTPTHSDADHHKKKKKKPKHSDKDHHHSDSDHHKNLGWFQRIGWGGRVGGYWHPKYPKSDRFGRKAINTTNIGNSTRQSEVAPGPDLRSVGYYVNSKPSAGGLKEKLFGNSTGRIIGDVIDSIRGKKHDKQDSTTGRLNTTITSTATGKADNNETNNSTGSIVGTVANSSTEKKDDKQSNDNGKLLGDLNSSVKQKRGKVWHGWHTHETDEPEKPPVQIHGYHTHPNEIWGEKLEDCPLRKREIKLDDHHKHPILTGNAIPASASADNEDLGQQHRPSLPEENSG
ncbi:hypothetical protein IWX90DRAFT_138562 [Phyllosticta citrichinensis]|uniref:Uncharacterized protein n=1 Tax=Phyllosticta citrichinensis TaxID=1130410 RepID=A0ABR1XYR9_9PEZI